MKPEPDPPTTASGPANKVPPLSTLRYRCSSIKNVFSYRKYFRSPSRRGSFRQNESKTKERKHRDDAGKAKLVSPSPAVAAGDLPEAFGKMLLKVAIGSTIFLYLLNQKHMLPRPIAKVVSHALFWPTLPITLSTRIGNWVTSVDDVIVMGGAPFGFANYPERLYSHFGVRGIINMCDEYAGPVQKYEQLGMRHIRLRTVDHFEPAVEHLKEAVMFLMEHEKEGSRCYVHCRAGHGRSAAVVLAWLLYKHPGKTAEHLNHDLCKVRNVRKTLWNQPNIIEFSSWLKAGGRLSHHNIERDDRHYNRAEQVSNAQGGPLNSTFQEKLENHRELDIHTFTSDLDWEESNEGSDSSSDDNT